MLVILNLLHLPGYYLLLALLCTYTLIIILANIHVALIIMHNDQNFLVPPAGSEEIVAARTVHSRIQHIAHGGVCITVERLYPLSVRVPSYLPYLERVNRRNEAGRSNYCCRALGAPMQLLVLGNSGGLQHKGSCGA